MIDLNRKNRALSAADSAFYKEKCGFDTIFCRFDNTEKNIIC